ncbi:sulfite exporter TauE/SafE family protein [Alphaproteobacteria bacterium]|nr:sulfite exporter TauE/SafE family protein [Alphaproteobacteria bacterium]
MFILGLLGAFVMGSVLSLLGAGGSILTMPVLVYLFSIPALEATSYSLLIVGLTALLGSIGYFRQGTIDIKTAIIFGIPSILGVLLARHYLLPSIPNEFKLGVFITKDFVIMFVFSVLMILAALMMMKKNQKKSHTQDIPKNKFFLVVLEGLVVGGVTGFVGAGGGFLIIPALVLLAGLEMKIAVGTSLIIIALKSIIGFGGDLIGGFQTDWILVFYIMSATLVGVLVGNFLSQKFTGEQLKKYFGIMVLVIGFYIVTEQIINL